MNRLQAGQVVSQPRHPTNQRARPQIGYDAPQGAMYNPKAMFKAMFKATFRS
jgi:hypothetical protein